MFLVISFELLVVMATRTCWTKGNYVHRAGNDQ